MKHKEILDCAKCGKEPLVAMFRNRENGQTHYAFYSPVDERPHPSYFEDLENSPFFLKFAEAAEYWNKKQEEQLTPEQKNAILRSERLKEKIDLMEVRRNIYRNYFSFIDDEGEYGYRAGIKTAIPYLKDDVERFVDFVIQKRETIADIRELVDLYLETYPYVKEEYYGIKEAISETDKFVEKAVQQETESPIGVVEETGKEESEK